MNPYIHSELAAVLNDWHTGRTVKTIHLGHPEHKDFSQDLVHECVFKIIEVSLQEGLTDDFEAFHSFSEDIARGLKLSPEEQGAAISLAWIALRRGWKSALAGHPEHMGLSLNRRTQA